MSQKWCRNSWKKYQSYCCAWGWSGHFVGSTQLGVRLDYVEKPGKKETQPRYNFWEIFVKWLHLAMLTNIGITQFEVRLDWWACVAFSGWWNRLLIKKIQFANTESKLHTALNMKDKYNSTLKNHATFSWLVYSVYNKPLHFIVE